MKLRPQSSMAPHLVTCASGGGGARPRATSSFTDPFTETAIRIVPAMV